MALHILALVKSLPETEQREISAALHQHVQGAGKTRHLRFERTPDGGYHNPDGLPNDDPFFKIMEQIEEERHQTPARPLPAFD